MKVNGDLVICDTCKCPLIIENEVAQVAIEFWRADGKVHMRPHAEGCTNRV